MNTTGLQQALVIDDEPGNQDVFARMLQLAGFAVTSAGTAAEAMEVIPSLMSLSLIVIDRQLPDIDGIDLLAQLRFEHPDALLVMATVQDDDSIVERAFEVGCDIFLVKPYGLVELVTSLRNRTFERSAGRQVGDRNGLHPYRSYTND